jgi:hypothetical protein
MRIFAVIAPAATVEKYARDIRAFAAWLSGADVPKEHGGSV